MKDYSNNIKSKNHESMKFMTEQKKESMSSIFAKIMEKIEETEKSFSYKKNHSDKKSYISTHGTPLIPNNSDLNKFITPLLPNKFNNKFFNTQNNYSSQRNFIFGKLNTPINSNEKEENTPPNQKRNSEQLEKNGNSHGPHFFSKNLISNINCIKVLNQALR